VLDIFTLLATNAADRQEDIDDESDVYQPQYTVDGVNPDAAGVDVMTQALQQAVTQEQQAPAARQVARQKMLDAAKARLAAAQARLQARRAK
jgi:DnaJ-domain-containing protein 1